MSLISNMMTAGVKFMSSAANTPILEYSSDEGSTWQTINRSHARWREKDQDPDYIEEQGGEGSRRNATLTATVEAPRLYKDYLIRVNNDDARVWAIDILTGDECSFFRYECKQQEVDEYRRDGGRLQ